MITDADIARTMRALAADRMNPLSVACISCRVTAGESCIETESSGPPPHRARAVDARLTSDGAANRLLVELSRTACG